MAFSTKKLTLFFTAVTALCIIVAVPLVVVEKNRRAGRKNEFLAANTPPGQEEMEGFPTDTVQVNTFAETEQITTFPSASTFHPNPEVKSETETGFFGPTDGTQMADSTVRSTLAATGETDQVDNEPSSPHPSVTAEAIGDNVTAAASVSADEENVTTTAYVTEKLDSATFADEMSSDASAGTTEELPPTEVPVKEVVSTTESPTLTATFDAEGATSSSSVFSEDGGATAAMTESVSG